MRKVQAPPLTTRGVLQVLALPGGDAWAELAGFETGTQKTVLLTPSPMVPLLTVSLPSWAGLEWSDFPDQRTESKFWGHPGQLP